MRMEIVKVRRLPDWPIWPVAVFCLWGGLVVATLVLAQLRRKEIVLCVWRNLTGIPCPSCGSTRGVLALLRGDWLGPWRHNPLVATLGAVVLALAVLRVGFCRAFRVHLSRPEKLAAWCLALAALAANWAYVIWRGN